MAKKIGDAGFYLDDNGARGQDRENWNRPV